MDSLTIWDAAAHPSALTFMLVGTGIVLPFLLGYTFYAYRIFRGKVKGGSPYG
jgi:cytochrome d ubiquinol oxidase subunit II